MPQLIQTHHACLQLLFHKCLEVIKPILKKEGTEKHTLFTYLEIPAHAMLPLLLTSFSFWGHGERASAYDSCIRAEGTSLNELPAHCRVLRERLDLIPCSSVPWQCRTATT